MKNEFIDLISAFSCCAKIKDLINNEYKTLLEFSNFFRFNLINKPLIDKSKSEAEDFSNKLILSFN